MGSAELRRRFHEYFEQRGHRIVPSASLVPANDPTLLFTNAGMVQFKDVFLGKEERDYKRAVTSQRCVRAGGKHNDLENVGYTARHHTFFEMLGNFSFGDYFKKEAIEYAWGLLTKEFGLPPERLWVTVYVDDDEAADLWLNHIGIPEERFARISGSDNFWQMGDTGPCGPCSEIFYDHGPGIEGGPPGTPEEDGDRYVEIWNLVFMQYDRDADGTMNPLPAPCVDTGMGLERIAAVMQGVHDNYEIDLFRRLLDAVADLAQTGERDNASLRVIADHIRSCAFLIVDGVLPSNEGRGYVLRRIIRRAARHGYQLGLREPFFHRLVEPLIHEMGDAFPELVEKRELVERMLLKEERRFQETLSQGMKLLDDAMSGLTPRADYRETPPDEDDENTPLDPASTIPGDVAFGLYDTYGFPWDLTADIAREHGLRVDRDGFNRCMEEQQRRSRAASRFGADLSSDVQVNMDSTFSGYERDADEGRVIALYRDNEAVEALEAGEAGMVFLDNTPFYAEAGGQVGDRGRLTAGDTVFEVEDTRRKGQASAHIGRVLAGRVAIGTPVQAGIDADRRNDTRRNHSATHLLHAALRHVLGTHVQQKGSLVHPDYLRFDFSHFEPVTRAQLAEIERFVNAEIRRNSPAEVREMRMEDAVAEGAMALFGEKYGDQVRVLRIGPESLELCGGTHVDRTGDIGLCRILSETGVAAGVRRIEAVTGAKAIESLQSQDERLRRIAETVNAGLDEVEQRVEQVADRSRRLEKELEQAKARLASQAGGDLAAQAVEIDGLHVLAARLDDADSKTLRDTVDGLKGRLGAAAVVLGTVANGKVQLVAGVTNGETGRIRAGDLVNHVAGFVGGKGGGRPDMAQAGGNDPAGLDDGLADVARWVREQLG
ncbi:alanine--tRNA ligase [Halofilum ochraceum]|uniref:alanine--tRNA ligase n=1 Tax=Halofilum ochraceum TaxID=1611323 RepID=UPI0008DB14B5|nr:alanine--tRNA ligase [Halofilum ochraceum]